MQLGDLTGYSWQHLGAVERADIAPAEEVVAACERVLAAGGRLLSQFPAVVREQVAERHAREAARHGAITRPEPDIDWSRLAEAAARGSTVSAEMIDSLEEITERQRSLYHELTSAQMLVSVEAHLGLLVSLLRGTHPESLQRRISSAAGEAAGFAAWIWYDLGDEHKSAAFYQMASDLLREAGDPALDAYVTAYQALTFDANGLVPEAIDGSEKALVAGTGTASRLTRAWLCAVAASATAREDRRRADALALLAQARNHLEAADGKEEWMYEFDHASLADYAGQTHLRLGQPTEAIGVFTEGLQTLPATCERRGAQLTVGLAEAHLGGGQVDEAVNAAGRSLAVFAARGSAAGLRRVKRVRDLLRQAGHVRRADELDEQVRTTLNAVS